MKHRKLISALILAALIIGTVVVFSFKSAKPVEAQDGQSMGGNPPAAVDGNNGNKRQTTIKSTCEVKAASVEKIEPHAGYYLEEVCVEKNQYIKQGDNILKYTNGSYLTAPYDCTITALELPDLESKILNSHYVQIESNNILSVTMDIDEEKINKISTGTQAAITVTGKEYTGYVTHISGSASSGKFPVTIEFENDGNVKLGMTASVEISV